MASSRKASVIRLRHGGEFITGPEVEFDAATRLKLEMKFRAWDRAQAVAWALSRRYWVYR